MTHTLGVWEQRILHARENRTMIASDCTAASPPKGGSRNPVFIVSGKYPGNVEKKDFLDAKLIVRYTIVTKYCKQSAVSD
jgi:hypothetical protein